MHWPGSDSAKPLPHKRRRIRREQACRRAVELSPGCWERGRSVADFLMQRSELEKAKDICAAAADASPDIPNIYLKLAEISRQTAELGRKPEILRDRPATRALHSSAQGAGGGILLLPMVTRSAE